jgi:hypothetical protein
LNGSGQAALGITINGGNGASGVSGDAISLNAGNGGSTGTGADINLSPGAGGSTSGAAGSTTNKAGNGTGAFHLAGQINAALTSTGNGADTTEDALQSYSLPANSLDQAGRCVRISAWGTLANNADSKIIRLYFGASVISSGSLTLANVNWVAEMIVCKTGSSTQSVRGTMQVGTTLIPPYWNAGTDTDASAITIKTTGQAGTTNASDIVSKGQLVEYLS